MRGGAGMIPGNGMYGLTAELSLFVASSQLVTGQEPKKDSGNIHRSMFLLKNASFSPCSLLAACTNISQKAAVSVETVEGQELWRRIFCKRRQRRPFLLLASENGCAFCLSRSHYSHRSHQQYTHWSANERVNVPRGEKTRYSTWPLASPSCWICKALCSLLQQRLS